MTIIDSQATPAADTPCTRHGAHRWMAYCSDCTAWHLAHQLVQRHATAAAEGPRTRAVPLSPMLEATLGRP